MAKITTTDHTKCWRMWRNWNLHILLPVGMWNGPAILDVWQVFKKLNIDLPYDSAIPLLGFYWREMKGHAVGLPLYKNLENLVMESGVVAWGWERGVGRMVCKGAWGNFGEWWIYSLCWLWWCFHKCIHMSKLIKFDTWKCAVCYTLIIPQ